VPVGQAYRLATPGEHRAQGSARVEAAAAGGTLPQRSPKRHFGPQNREELAKMLPFGLRQLPEIAVAEHFGFEAPSSWPCSADKVAIVDCFGCCARSRPWRGGLATNHRANASS
jgi:hypothetical protein